MVGRDCSPTLVTPGSTLPLALGGDGQEGGHFSPLHAAIWHMKGGSRPTLMFSELVHLCPCQRGPLCCAAQMKGGLNFLSVAGKGVSSLIS